MSSDRISIGGVDITPYLKRVHRAEAERCTPHDMAVCVDDEGEVFHLDEAVVIGASAADISFVMYVDERGERLAGVTPCR